MILEIPETSTLRELVEAEITLNQLYQMFKARYEQEQADVLMKQWGNK